MAMTFQAHCVDIQCEGCANAITRSLSKMEGVAEVHVDIAGKNVSVQYDGAMTKEEALRKRLEAAGFPPA